MQFRTLQRPLNDRRSEDVDHQPDAFHFEAVHDDAYRLSRARRSVERQRDPEDRRVVRIIITTDGRRHLAEGTAIFRGHLAKRFSALGEEELLLLSESLGNLQTIFAKIR